MIKRYIISLCLAFIFSGCSSYTSQVFFDNKLSSTPNVKPQNTPDPNLWDNNKITYSWLGHSTVLINFYGIKIITDPVLGQRIGPPEIWGNMLGIKRISELPLNTNELNDIDLILISHSHFDHLDKYSLNLLADNNANPVAIVPTNTSDLIPGNIKSIELPWNEAFTSVKDDNELKIKSFRVEHYSYSGWGERNKYRGFNGYLISGSDKQIAFFGDTSYARYRDKYGKFLGYKNPVKVDWKQQVGNTNPIDLCIVPIGDYYYRHNHAHPTEIIKITRSIQCLNTMPVHFNTFILTPRKLDSSNPKSLYIDALRSNDMDDLCRCKTPAGNTIHFPDIGDECILE